jgi:hypothetical protein
VLTWICLQRRVYTIDEGSSSHYLLRYPLVGGRRYVAKAFQPSIDRFCPAGTGKPGPQRSNSQTYQNHTSVPQRQVNHRISVQYVVVCICLKPSDFLTLQATGALAAFAPKLYQYLAQNLSKLFERYPHLTHKSLFG